MRQNLPLRGLTVLALEQAVAAPYCTSRLADAGARVIKIERAEGDFARGYDASVNGLASYFVWLNRGKESLVADIKDPADARLLHAILAQTDVFVQNLAPGAAARAGFGAAELRARHPRLITVDISGYGADNAYSDMKAYDLLVQAESGLAAITGHPAGPGRVGVSVCDIAAGMTAFQGILQALIGRGRTGEGRHVAVSLYHALADWMNVPYLQYVYGGHTPVRSGLNHPTIAPYGDYVCQDGKAVLFSIQNETEWRALCDKVLGRPEVADDERFATNPLRVANRPALDAVINEVFGAAPRERIIERLEAARIAYGRVSTLEDLKEHPQNRTVTVETQAGPVTMLAPGMIFDGALPQLGPVPRVGEHTDAIRAEFGSAPRAATEPRPASAAASRRQGLPPRG